MKAKRIYFSTKFTSFPGTTLVLTTYFSWFASRIGAPFLNAGPVQSHHRNSCCVSLSWYANNLIPISVDVVKPLDFNLLLRTVRDLLDELPEQRLARMMGKAPPLRFYSSNGKEFEA